MFEDVDLQPGTIHSLPSLRGDDSAGAVNQQDSGIPKHHMIDIEANIHAYYH